jgi:F0F1-type ATP synthase membrane subunit b/b'
VIKREPQNVTKQIDDLKRVKHESDELSKTLQNKVTELSAENQEMRSQINANKKQVIQKAQSELNADPF